MITLEEAKRLAVRDPDNRMVTYILQLPEEYANQTGMESAQLCQQFAEAMNGARLIVVGYGAIWDGSGVSLQ